MKMREPGVSREEIEAIAADWVIRLEEGPMTPEEQDILDVWLSAKAEHRDAFDHASATWRELGALQQELKPAAEPAFPAREAAALSLPVRQSRPAGRPARCMSRFPSAVRAGAMAAGLLLTIGLASLWEGDPITLLTSDFRTDPGETRTITLDDGSEVVLGPSSAMALRFDETRRGFDLLSGIAYVSVSAKAADAQGRPFRIDANQGAATALGTQFMVERMSDAVRVTVTEHDVEVVAVAENGAAASVVLHPGESVRYSASEGMENVERISLARVMAWREGRLVFDRVPLSDVVAVLNRYRRGRIVIADPGLAERTVSGSFNTTDLDHALHAITKELDASTAELPPFVTLLF